LDVLLGEALPTPADVAGRVVVVIDVLRAATTIVEALAQGARAVVPFAEVDEAVAAARQYGRDVVRLAGERRGRVIPGFDAGNSPREMRPALVAGRTVLMTTTNGTGALLATHGAWRTFVGTFANLTVTAEAVVRELRDGRDGLLVCAGQDRHVALEDAACAGVIAARVTRALPELRLGDAAQTARRLAVAYEADPGTLADDAAHARALAADGFGDDVAWCLTVDRHDVLATFVDRQVTGERVVHPA
jgi:2-phosphosulfolactate phosphatase